MLKVDADGVVIWELTFGEPNGGTPEQMYEECYGVRAVASGGYVTGCGTGVEPGNEVSASDPLNIWRAYVVRVNELGVIQWQASYGSPESNNAAEFILATRDGGFAVIADSDQYSEGAANLPSSSWGQTLVECMKKPVPLRVRRTGSLVIFVLAFAVVNHCRREGGGAFRSMP